ncbi:lipopolysaccharide biosynthesis protein [Streptomyces sp. WAC05374]|uniref:lipopolysaccharide biosynthesis protein n=1 Tax=Streptomyces sp. WAC05374 TaxID=2487420 RepID=UPI001F3F2E05|nr:lipopolysaccharide biosynthesis protein [Streptomyces sp. WAC05374]
MTTTQSLAVRRAIGWLTRLRRTRRRWLVPAAALLGVLTGGAYGLLATPEYAATSYVIVVPSAKSDPAGAMGLAQAYGRVATDIAVVGDAPVAAGVPASTLRASVRAVTSPDAPMIAITARAPEAAAAAGMADSVARALVQKGSHTEGSTGVKVLQFTRAATPTGPVSPSASLSALVGGCAGGLLGGLALLVRPRYGRRRARYGSVPGPGAQPAAQAEALV